MFLQVQEMHKLFSIHVTLSAEGDGASYLLFAQGKSILQLPFEPTPDNPGQQTLQLKGILKIINYFYNNSEPIWCSEIIHKIQTLWIKGIN